MRLMNSEKVERHLRTLKGQFLQKKSHGGIYPVTGRTNYTLLFKANFNKFIQRIRRLQRNHAVCCKMKKNIKNP